MAVQIHINVSDPRPIYRQIIDEVRRAVVRGALQRDDALPSVRQLAVDLRVNPNTVTQAYRELEREGVVYVRRGEGTFVADVEVDVSARNQIVRSIAERAVIEIHRSGADVDALIDAIREVADAHPTLLRQDK
jgi:GntR family transcriptional regulator